MATGVRQDPRRGLLDRGADDAGRLFETYSDRILLYCLHVLRNRAEAEDAVQTTFLYAQRALHRGVVPLSEYAWLHTIAKNVCRSQQRTAARRRLVLTDVDLDGLPSRAEADDDLRELASELGDALSSIPESQRRALLMREWQGLSPAEIAHRLGLSAPATYALLTRARRSVAEAMSATRSAALGLNVWPLLLRLKGLLSGVAPAAATAVAATAFTAGGLALERTLVDRGSARPLQSPVSAEVASAPTRRFVAEAGSRARMSVAVQRRTRAQARAESTGTSAGTATSAGPSGPASPELPGGPSPAPPGTEVQPEAPASETPDPLLEVPIDPLPLPEVELPPVPEIVPEEPPILGDDPLEGLVPDSAEVPLVPDPGLPTLP